MTTIRDITVQLANEELQSIEKDRALLILGSKDSGKSTLVALWLGKNIPNPTIKSPGLEYFWSRKSNKLCHIWEFPEPISQRLIGAVLRPNRSFKNNLLLVLLDLSEPGSLPTIAKQIFDILENYPSLQVIILGGKYDIFQNLESEIKKQVCKFLRGVSILLSASLIFYSNEIPALVKQLSDVLNTNIWNLHASRSTITRDHHAPLFIPSNGDSWEDLGIQKCNLQQLIDAFTTHWKK